MTKIPKVDEICDYKPPKSSVNSREDELETHSKTLLKSFENKNKWPITYKGPSVRLSGIIFYDNFMVLNVQSSYIQNAKRKQNEGGWWVNLMEECSPSICKSPGSIFMTSFFLFWKPSLWPNSCSKIQKILRVPDKWKMGCALPLDLSCKIRLRESCRWEDKTPRQ